MCCNKKITNKNKVKFSELKLSYKNECTKFVIFSKQNGSFLFPPKGDTETEKC